MTKPKHLLTLCILALLPTAAFAWEKDRPATPPVIPPNHNNLPKVLLIGDSISSGYPNLYADISCTVGRSPIGKDKPMVREFFIRHADKLLFGSDSGWWSLGKDRKQAGEFTLIDELKLPKEVEDKICRENSERLFWSDMPKKSATK